MIQKWCTIVKRTGSSRYLCSSAMVEWSVADCLLWKGLHCADVIINIIITRNITISPAITMAIITMLYLCIDNLRMLVLIPSQTCTTVRWKQIGCFIFNSSTSFGNFTFRTVLSSSVRISQNPLESAHLLSSSRQLAASAKNWMAIP